MRFAQTEADLAMALTTAANEANSAFARLSLSRNISQNRATIEIHVLVTAAAAQSISRSRLPPAEPPPKVWEKATRPHSMRARQRSV